MNYAIRQKAHDIFDCGVQAADPVQAVDHSLKCHPLPAIEGDLYVISIGKAAVGMARAVLKSEARPAKTLIVTNYENATKVAGATVLAAGHPVPDENGAAAANAVLEILNNAGPGDHVLVLISGGGSALLPAPVCGISLQDKAEVSKILLAAGIDIQGMNLVRQQLSRLKGGGLLGAAAPAPVSALILSDVIGDDLRVIASGPTVAPIGTLNDARKLLQNIEVWKNIPISVQGYLSGKQPDQVELAAVTNRLVGSNSISVTAMAAFAENATVFPDPLIGDVADAAETICACTGEGTWLFGGETTVRLTGNGMGGRNQELALRVALLAEQNGWVGDWVFLSGGTDGRDGPTDAAGGIVDGGTLARIRTGGVDPLAALANNDSYHALKAAGDLLITGATGTNVADLQVLIRL